jgi:hypothetical protein
LHVAGRPELQSSSGSSQHSAFTASDRAPSVASEHTCASATFGSCAVAAASSSSGSAAGRITLP